MDWFHYIPFLIQYGSEIRQIISTATSNDDLATKLKKLVPAVVPLLEQYGAYLFPQAATTIHAVGGAIAAYDQNKLKWLQGALNKVLSPSPMLEVDGIYGPMTTRAVQRVQAQLGLKIDGLAGKVTQAAVEAAVTKL